MIFLFKTTAIPSRPSFYLATPRLFIRDDINMTSEYSLKACVICPNRHYGFCLTLLQTLDNELEKHFIKKLQLPAGDFAFRQGDSFHGFFILKSGWMLLSRLTEEGKRQVLRPILPGKIFGLQPDQQTPTFYSAQAIQDTDVCNISWTIQLCTTHPDLAMRLIWASACDKLVTEMYLTQICQRSARERVAFMVLELFRNLKLRGLSKDNIMPFPLKQEDIADMLGLTTIHVNRTLHALKNDGLFSIHQRELTILDYEGLCNLVGSIDKYMAYDYPMKS